VLDVALENISLGNRVHDITLTFPKSTHTAIVGAAGAGASTLLQIIAGQLRPSAGHINIGAHDVTKLAASRRPLLFATGEIDAPSRWSVDHLLIAAVRQRSLDRVDRQREYEQTIEKWRLSALTGRSLRSLSSSERAIAHLAQIELLRPAILVADRLLEPLNPSIAASTSDAFYRTLRVMGTTAISAPANAYELGMTDRLVVLDKGRVVQNDFAPRIYRNPASESAAMATGDVNVIPITIRGKDVESPIGSWTANDATFEGNGIALARPEDFFVAEKGQESDLIFGIEEASFQSGRWIATGILTGALNLRVALPGDAAVHKGRLIPLRFDPARFTLLRGTPFAASL
jgi:ABC-type Fe3+/spermidine/putrescine transport system ATPase subunit